VRIRQSGTNLNHCFSTPEAVESYKKAMRDKYEAEQRQLAAKMSRDKQLNNLLTDLPSQSTQPSTQHTQQSPQQLSGAATVSPTHLPVNYVSTPTPNDGLDALLRGLDELVSEEEKEARAMKTAYENYKLKPQHMTGMPNHPYYCIQLISPSVQTQWKNQYY